MAKKEWYKTGKAYTDKKGRKGIWLSPSAKGGKYADELHLGFKKSNSGEVKVNKNGEPIALSKTQSAWRSGYLAARKDSASLYNYKKKLK